MGLEVQDFTKEQQEAILQRYSQLTFANLKKNIIQDLINNNNESVIYKKYRKEDIVRMLENPQKHERQIRDLSGFIYLVSSHYRRLVDYYATILLYSYTIIPTKISVNKINKTQYKEDYLRVVNLADKYNLRHEGKKALKIAVRDGVFFGICYESEDSFYIKNVNANLCKITSIEDGVFRFSFDMAYFDRREDLLDMYGQDFTMAYYAYRGNKEKGIKGDKKKKWYEVPNGIVVLADESNFLTPLPTFLGLLMQVFEIEDSKMLQKVKRENENSKVLSFKLETQEGIPTMDYDLAAKYFQTATSSLEQSGNWGAILTPWEVDDFSFSTNNNDTDAIKDAEDNFFYSAGTNPLLFGSAKATSSNSISLSVKPDEALSYSMLEQFQRYFNMRLKKLNLKNSFKIEFLQVSIFNQDEYTNRLSKSGSLGVAGKTLYASALGLSPSDMLGLTYLEENILSLSKDVWITPFVSSSVQSGTPSTEETGRPTAEESGQRIGDAGEASREQN